ncbi:winged helix DNA-binding domain-containing protein [Agromyces atrinae]|uniref:winged helix DNA-binding domain-containing protein n=1 Tax=Agromyces atrinae TaxID=592376 RepID=UPI001F55C1DB|nr:winged helix DNA-binding domain-containing protein [Agromyces atrinae]MCI2958608.1 winged helix DNA-binding domain-containing protein [Agromyces atrinae]
MPAPDERLRAERVHSHAVVDRLATPLAAVERMFALQAQDLPAALWAVGSRTAGSDVTDVRALIDSGSVVRSWPMRGTLHLLPAGDLAWILGLTADRVLRSGSAVYAREGIDDHVIGRAAASAEAALEGGRSLSRAEMHDVWTTAGIDVSGQRGYHLIVILSLQGLLCWGPLEGRAQRLVLSREWTPPSTRRQLDGDAALGEFFTRYLAGHAPASLADFAWWTGLTLGHARRALAEARHRVEQLPHRDVELWRLRDVAPPPETTSGVLALAAFDEYFLGYRDRSLVCDPAYAAAVIPGGNGVFQPVIVRGGRVIGTWARSGTPSTPTVTARPFTTLAARDRRALARDIRRWADFHGTTATLEEDA